MRKLVQVLQYIEAYHADADVQRHLVEHAIAVLLKDLDAHSSYLNTQAVNQQRGRAQSPEDSLVSPVSNERGLPMIRTSLRSSEARPSAMNPARSPVSGATVSSQLLDESRAYVRIRQFTEQTPAELVDSLNGLSRAAPEGLGGIVLDLRDNPGGLLRAAVAVSAVFLPEDSLVLYTDGAGKESKARYLARPDFYLKGGQADILAGMPGIYKSLPLIVLVNGMSASAAEIVAGALKDHGRAKIVGTVTYGKGTVQRVVSLADNTAIKFTMAYYYSPNGHRIQQQGVKPDVVVDNQSFSAGDECGMGSSESRDFASVVVDNSADDEDCQLRHAIHLLH